MDAKFHALTSDDIKDIGPFVKSNDNVDAYDLLESPKYMEFEKMGVERLLGSTHVRKVIKLVAPTFNHVLGRSNCTLLQKMLGFDQKTWIGIVEMKKVFDMESLNFVDIDETMDGGDYLYGAQIAEYFIKNLDIEKELIECLYNVAGDFFRVSVDPRDVLTINKNPENGTHLADKYFAHYDPVALQTGYKRGRDASNFEYDFKNLLFKNEDSRLSYLLNMNPDKSGLYGMLNYYIVVIPEEMRPKIDNQEHRLTKLYTKVIHANYVMQTNISSMSPKVKRQSYLSLELSVKKLQYKNQGTSRDVTPDDLSLLERVKSKKGQIRMRNLGKRQDYSGRAVVCINPYLPLDVIRVPQFMLPKLLEFHILPYLAKNIKRNNYEVAHNQHMANIYDHLRLGNLETPETRTEMLRIINDEHLLDKIPGVLGRQPTLHKQSLQGFHLEISDLQAIEVNPLVCPAFNMDFDGDQAHIEIPLSEASIKEVNDLVLTTQNLFLPKTGECTTEPRQDMLYGLWLCTNNSYKIQNPVQSYSDLNEVRDAVIKHQIKVWDTVTVLSIGGPIIAGDAAFMACFPKGDIVPRGTISGSGKLSVEEINKKSITKYIDYMLRTDSSGNFVHKIGTGHASTETFVGTINALVELGFRVARLYIPNMSMLMDSEPIPEYDKAIDKFYDDMSDIDLYYNLGLETSDNYKIVFSKNLDKLNNTRRDGVLDKLGKDSGYVKLSVSGARGSKDNLLQTFSIKGQVKKNSTEAFDALLENAYGTQLTPLEHFVAAYGGRQGQIDKSLKTGDTGYAMRQMWHATQGMMITCEDCGTTRGITIKKSDLTIFIDDDSNKEKLNAEVEDMFAHTILGRYKVGSNKLITEAEAKAWAHSKDVESIVIRSPLTCNNPCCKKCYGIDWSTRKPAVVGLPVGIIAAQSIGEPGTQLTLKTFQQGGVAGQATVTSAFDRVDHYIHLHDLADLSKRGKYPGYDPLAWATGPVNETPASDINMKVITIGDNKKKRILVPKDVVLKTEAVKGHGLSYKHGDYDLREIIAYSGVEAAQQYLMFKLYALYKSEVKIKTIHFEVLVGDMTRYMIVATDRSDLMVGQYATAQELYRGNVKNTEYIQRLVGVKGLINASHSALDSIIMESQVEGLSRICLLGMSDSLTKPLNRMVLGQSILDGSAKPGFIENRKESI
jgi:DNA-directed RNA polymerase subunit beta'